MSQEKIESRRAFMKKFGKLAGVLAFAAPFVAMTAKDVGAASEAEKPPINCRNWCTYNCLQSCVQTCRYSCFEDHCGGTCAMTCKWSSTGSDS